MDGGGYALSNTALWQVARFRGYQRSRSEREYKPSWYAYRNYGFYNLMERSVETMARACGRGWMLYVTQAFGSKGWHDGDGGDIYLKPA